MSIRYYYEGYFDGVSPKGTFKKNLVYINKQGEEFKITSHYAGMVVQKLGEYEKIMYDEVRYKKVVDIDPNKVENHFTQNPADYEFDDYGKETFFLSVKLPHETPILFLSEKTIKYIEEYLTLPYNEFERRNRLTTYIFESIDYNFTELKQRDIDMIWDCIEKKELIEGKEELIENCKRENIVYKKKRSLSL